MTVTRTTANFVATANGVTTAFPALIHSIFADDIDVYFRSTITGYDTLQATNTYTVTGLEDAAGVTVTFNTAPADGTIVVVVRSVRNQQNFAFSNQRGYDVNTVEDSLDTLTMQVQQVSSRASRSISAPFGDSLETLPAAAQRAGKLIRFDDDGQPQVETVATILGEAARVYANVFAMTSSEWLSAGMTIQTLGYYTENDGGGALYYTESAGDFGGTPDGFADHTTASGVIAVLYKAGPTFIMEQWGVADEVESSARMQACADAALAVNDGGIVPVNITMACRPYMKDQVSFGDASANIMFIDFTRAEPSVISGGNISATVPAMKFQIQRSEIYLGRIYLNKLGAGFWFFSCRRSFIHQPFAYRFIGYGIRMSGGNSGNATLNGHGGMEWDRDDAEFALGETSFLYPGLIIDGADMVVTGGGMAWCDINIRLDSGAANVWFNGVHPFNGNPDFDEPGTVLRTDPINVYSEAGGKTYWANCYFDNGYIKDATNKMQIMDSQHLVLVDRVAMVKPYIRALSGEDASDDRFIMAGTKSSFGYYTGDFDTVDPDFQYITDNSADYSGTGSWTVVSQQVNFINSSNSVNPDMQFTHKGTSTVWWQILTNNGADPVDDVIDVYFGNAAVTASAPFVSKGRTPNGYGIGSGAILSGSAQTVRSDILTMNGPTGRIGWPTGTGSASWDSFPFYNNALGLDDVVELTQKGGTNVYQFVVLKAAPAGQMEIYFRSLIGTATDSPTIDFVIHRGSVT